MVHLWNSELFKTNANFWDCIFVLLENECNEYVMEHLADSDLIPS